MCLYIIVFQPRPVLESTTACNVLVPGKGGSAPELQVPSGKTKGLTGCCLQRLFHGTLQISNAEKGHETIIP